MRSSLLLHYTPRERSISSTTGKARSVPAVPSQSEVRLDLSSLSARAHAWVAEPQGAGLGQINETRLYHTGPTTSSSGSILVTWIQNGVALNSVVCISLVWRFPNNHFSRIHRRRSNSFPERIIFL